MIFGIVAVVVLLLLVLVAMVVITSSAEKVLKECGYLKGRELKNRVSLAKGFELFIQVEFTRNLTDREINRLNFVADLYGANTEKEFVASLYGYNNLLLTFVFHDLNKADEALEYFKKHCHAIDD